MAMEGFGGAIFGFFDRFGLAALFLFTFFQELGVPLLLPNELVLGFFGAQAAHGRWSLGLLIAVATLGDILGTVGLFLIARKISIAAIERFGAKIGIKHERIASLELKLRRWEMAGVFVGRTIPFVRIYTSLAAAVLRMPFWEFFVPAVGGAIVWASLFLLVGFFLREQWGTIAQYIPVDIGQLVFLVLVFGVAVVFLRRQRRNNDSVVK